MSLDAQGLYHPSHEHDACGVGFVAHIKGKRSHTIVEQGLTVLRNLTHRGAVGWDPKLSDGAGLLIQIPDRFLREEMARLGVRLPPAGQYGVGMVFLPRDPASRIACEYEIERAIKEEGQVLLGWRDVPVDNSDLAEPARRIEPVIRQVFIGRGRGITVTDALERKLYIIRKSSGHAIQALRLKHGKEFYVPSMSARTVCYKGMLLAYQVGEYYLDLKDARVESALALVHQRFSTNTFPSWDLAHPFRMICHNGEINTVRGNVNWIRARQGAISSPILGADLHKIWPLIYDGQSDSASFDNALELLVMGGYSVAHAMMMMIPEAWENHTLMDPARRAFYEYHAAMMEPWDGPASIAFTDGRQIGATLDRNGLRPSRYIVTDDDLVIMGSECGCLPVPEEKIIKKWRLQPGKMFLVDLEKGRIVDDKELKDSLASARPYAEWIERIRDKLDEVESDKTTPIKSKVRLLDRQQAFAYTQEDLKFIMQPMAAAGEEPVGSMGNDSPLAVLSDKNKTLYHYFKQLFAQVTRRCGSRCRSRCSISTRWRRCGISSATPAASSRPSSSTSPTPWPGARPRWKRASLRSPRRPRTRCARAIRSSSFPIAWWTASAWPSRRCSRFRRSTSTSSARACARRPAWWSRPAARAKCTTLRCSGAMAQKRCIPILPWKPFFHFIFKTGLRPRRRSRAMSRESARA